MPRIRSIKPEIWADEALGACPRDARLLFIGLITQADDAGRFRAAPALLRASIFPYDESLNKDRVQDWLEALGGAGLVSLYAVKGEQYGEFPSWTSHQRIDRPSESKIPPIGASDPALPPDSTNTRRSLDEPSSLEGRGEEGKGKDRGVIFEQIYQQWSDQPGLIRHRRPTPAMKRAAAKALTEHDADEVIDAIALYATVLTSEQHWFTYPWRLEEFLARGVSKFVPSSGPLTRYFGAGPDANGKHATPERDPEAAHRRDLDGCRRIYRMMTDQGMSQAEARAEAAGTYPDAIVAEAIGAA
jgi:hypothetical protein